MTKPKQWTGRKQEQPKRRRSSASIRHEEYTKANEPKPLMAPVEPIPDEIEVLDEQTTLGDST